ncbi:hypothetical protein ACA910_006551 [Epithemia clementina (nom. ined.)]
MGNRHSNNHNQNQNHNHNPSKVLVLGASGYVGKATLSHLVSRHGNKLQIFAGVRDPVKFGAIDGVQVIQADMGSSQKDLAAALRDFDSVYVVTPGSEDRAKLALNAIHAAKDAGVKYTLVLSVLTADLTDTIFGKQFTPVEKEIKTIGLKSYGIVRLPLFMDNFYAAAQSIKEQGTMYDPRNPNKVFTPIAVQDVGKASADILANPKAHHNKTYKLVMPSFTLQQLVQAFGETLKKPINVTTVPYPAAKEAFMGLGFPEWQVDGIFDLFHLIDEDSRVTNETNHTSDFTKITGEKPMTMTEWVQANAAGFQ